MAEEEVKLSLILLELEILVERFCLNYSCMLPRMKMLEVIARNVEVIKIR